ncbi:[protein release factor]-glutamine N5-methyltransferase [Paraglaciecola sp. T6c]|uniref:peptide chain release factor N(5)-glutamine methyltransferase n=1 Tax=Pseudoalteromonas atlantica (strain T6c / ATCC BAA-1087) TaxID=3042615 RepID=UPI00005C72ED|nr:peptide chain release factor N(5)-glutamine methyltransferase [Paraglaciecola sp. T6c]ABG41078.1 [protein release factor]-glutamine N5-methyltransferase [Paraglaciecola sp. T6c]
MSTLQRALSGHSIAEQLALAKAQFIDSDSAALDSRLLMCHVLQCETAYLMTWPEKPLDELQLRTYQQLVAKRKTGYPIAYLLGYRDFWSLRLRVSPATLIPRPETELLVETVLNLPIAEDAHVLDLGTGTGAIALALASEKPNWQVLGIDKSADAVALAKQNAELNSLPQVRFMQSDWFSALEQTQLDQQNNQHNVFSLIVSNPPYVEDDSVYLQQGDVRFEPASALTSGKDGLDDIRIIISKAITFLPSGGWLAFEHGYQQAQGVQALLVNNGFEQVHSVNDLNDLPRITLGCLVSA